jgi:DNA-binding XRE family transcriptional regulator
MSDSETQSTRTARRTTKRRAVSFVENIRHPIVAQFGAMLRERRLEMDLTQMELAAAAGLSRSYLSEVECGRESISLERAAKLADALKCRLADLLT